MNPNSPTASAPDGNETVAQKLGRAFLTYPVWILLGYFLLNAITRALLGAPPELDEAEQFAVSTHYAFGYGPHPPLYQWLQTASFSLFGVNYAAIALLKNAILFGTYGMLYLLGWHLTRDPVLSAIGCFGLLFSTNFAWESQHDQSHTVSNTFLTVATTYLVFRAIENPRLWQYLLIGAAIGLWAMAKHNFIFPLLSLIIMLFAADKGRQFLRSPWITATLALAVAIPFFHYQYILENLPAATAKVSKLGIEEYGFLYSRILGTGAFLKAFIGVHAVWLILLVIFWIQHRQAKPSPAMNQNGSNTSQAAENKHLSGAQKSFVIFCMTTYILLFVFVLIAGTTRYRDHWMQPAAVFAPLFLAIVFRRFVTGNIFNQLAVLLTILMPAIFIAYLFNNFGIGTEKRDAALPAPQSMAEALPELKTGQPKLVFSDPRHRYRWLTAGHMRHNFPDISMVFDPETQDLEKSEFWLVWRAAKPDVTKAKSIYPALRDTPAEAFSTPVKVEHFRKDQLGEFKGTSWWVSRYQPPQ